MHLDRQTGLDWNPIRDVEGQLDCTFDPLPAPEHHPWRIACTSDSLNGIIAAAQAGLGITVLARKLVPSSLVELNAEFDLPSLGQLEFIVLRRSRAPSAAISELVALIVSRSKMF